MLADEVATVHQMARWQRIFRGKLDVATVAIARSPLILVLVATEADRHLGPQRFGLLDTDLDVAAHAVALRRRHVRTVLEFQMYSRKLSAAAHVRFAMAVVARARIVRFGVATHAVGRLGKMQGVLFARFGDALMTIETPDALEHVRAMFERVGRFAA